MVCNVGGKGKGAFIIIFPKALLCVAVFSELSFMYILLNSPKSSRHQGLENEKWLLLLPYFAQDPETPHVSGFPDRLHTPPSLAMSWRPRRAVYSFITITEAHMALGVGGGVSGVGAEAGKKLIKITLMHTWLSSFCKVGVVVYSESHKHSSK